MYYQMIPFSFRKFEACVEWSLLFVQLQVITLSYVNNCVIINLSFLFLVAIIDEDRKRHVS